MCLFLNAHRRVYTQNCLKTTRFQFLRILYCNYLCFPGTRTIRIEFVEGFDSGLQVLNHGVQYNRLVYSSQALRHVAEQIDGLCWETAQGREGTVLYLDLPCYAPTSGLPLLLPSM